jgi:PKD domain
LRKQRVAAAAALLVCAGAVSMPIPVQAAAASTFYVNNGAAGGCSDSTSDSSAKPYCTIQAAVNAAKTAGDTVDVTSGSYAPFKVTASGTAAAPITIKGVPAPDGTGPQTSITSSSAVGITLTGASYVNLDGFTAVENGNFSGLVVSGSSHIGLDRDDVQQNYVYSTGAGVSITGGSSYVTVSRSRIGAYSSQGGVYADGGSGDVITTNLLNDSNGPSAALVGVSSSDVTSNELLVACRAGISLTSGSDSDSVENNIGVVGGFSGSPTSYTCPMATAAQVDLLVDSSSTSGTTADYNDFSTISTSIPNLYSWAGVGYATPAAFTTATAQGTHDLNSITPVDAIDSANSDAPGELSSDLYGNARVDDPNIANTGAGTYAYYDRGPLETDDPIAATFSQSDPSLMPVGQSGTFSATVTDPWKNAITECTFDFGDGSAPTTVAAATGGTCSAPHAYSATGQYTITLSAEASDGYWSRQVTTAVSVDTASAFATPSLTLDAVKALGIQVWANATDDWSIASCTIDYGDGTTQTYPIGSQADDCGQSHTYAAAGTYTVTVTLTDADGNQTTASKSFVTGGSDYIPVAPKRILDTRHATGVSTTTPVVADGVVKLKITGVDGLPGSGVTAVALNVTATEATKLGFLTVYPDSSALPNTSNVDFSAGKNVANTVIVQVGADGYIDLANESSGTTHVLADLEGYYSAAAGSGYTSVTQKRLLDTRTTKTPIPAGGDVRLNLGSAYPGISAAVLNVTAVDATGNGYITAYPDGGTAPATSNVNYLTGQTVPNEVVVQVGADGYVDFADSGTGTADLLVDISGYFTPGSGAKFVPITPLRYLDTRDGQGEVDQGYQAVAKAGPGSVTDLDVGGIAEGNPFSVPVPSGAAVALAANVTVTQQTANGFIGVFPPGTGIPTSSVLNYRAGQQTQNAVTVGLGSSPFGDFDLYNASAGSTQLIVDVYGYYNTTGS